MLRLTCYVCDMGREWGQRAGRYGGEALSRLFEGGGLSASSRRVGKILRSLQGSLAMSRGLSGGPVEIPINTADEDKKCIKKTKAAIQL